FSGHVVPLTFSDHHVYYSLFFFMCAPLRSTLFPYTTLFRSCADIGVTRIECGEGFTEMTLKAADVVKMASERGLDVQFELGKKRSEEHTSELQSHLNLVCRLLLEKKNNKTETND